MKCIISKFIIDSREESGKELPRFVSEHLKTCSDCRAYMSIGRKLSSGDPYSIISDKSMTDLNQKIVSGLNHTAEGEKRRAGFRIFSPVPLAALFFIIVISIGIILFQGINKPIENNRVNPIPKLTASGSMNNLKDLFTKVESPIKREAEELRKTVNSAGEYLKSVMDFGLPGIPD